MSVKEYGLVVIKPKMLEQGLDNRVIQDLEKRNLTVVKRKLVSLRAEQAKQMYKEKRGKNYFPLLVDYMTSAPVMCLITKSNDSQNATEIAQKYRDWARTHLKLYRFDVTEDDVKLLDRGVHPLQDEITREMALQNLLHVPDTFSSVALCLNGILCEDDLDELKTREPKICEFLSEHQTPEIRLLPEPQ